MAPLLWRNWQYGIAVESRIFRDSQNIHDQRVSKNVPGTVGHPCTGLGLKTFEMKVLISAFQSDKCIGWSNSHCQSIESIEQTTTNRSWKSSIYFLTSSWIYVFRCKWKVTYCRIKWKPDKWNNCHDLYTAFAACYSVLLSLLSRFLIYITNRFE